MFCIAGRLPDGHGMDPRVYAASLRSLLRPRTTKVRDGHVFRVFLCAIGRDLAGPAAEGDGVGHQDGSTGRAHGGMGRGTERLDVAFPVFVRHRSWGFPAILGGRSKYVLAQGLANQYMSSAFCAGWQ